jgi:tetratricopeptide (TPR) repeat protein
MFGWAPALLFAFHPVNAMCTAWITGGYYSVTTFLALTALYFIQTFPNFLGGFIGSLFFTASLGGTICTLGMPFIFLFGVASPWGLMLFWPEVMYLFGKRFRAGFKIRNEGRGDKLTYKKLALMTKVTAYYLWIALVPNKLAFFRQYGTDYTKRLDIMAQMESFDKIFWASLAFLLLGFSIGWYFSPLGTMIFFCGIGVFSQYKLLGQFIAERYLYFPLVGFTLVVGTALQSNPILLAVLTTLYVYRTHLYIPAFKNMESLYLYGITNYPKCIANYCNLGEFYLHKGQLIQSRRLMEQALAMDPGSFLANTNMAAHWIMVKEYKMAREFTQKAIIEGKTSPAIKYVLEDQVRQLTKTINENIEIEKKLREEEAKDAVALAPAG